MKAADLANMEIAQTRAIAEATADPETLAYVQRCLSCCFAGNWGTMPAEDAESNDAELAAGEGRIIANYPQQGKLTGDIWIIAYFSEIHPGNTHYNNILILYPDEY